MCHCQAKFIERKEVSKLLVAWLQKDGGCQTNTDQLCKKAYARMNMITKLRYAGVGTEELIFLYKQYIRITLEYCSVVFRSSLLAKQSASPESCLDDSLGIIIQDD